jgi:hypothetical protein
MQSLSGLIVRVERAHAPDRRLDAEITAALLGPPGAHLDPIEMPDGCNILVGPDSGEMAWQWMDASDVLAVTGFLDAACELVGKALPHAPEVIVNGLRTLPSPTPDATADDVAGAAARAIMVEALRVFAAATSTGSRQRAA